MAGNDFRYAVIILRYQVILSFPGVANIHLYSEILSIVNYLFSGVEK